jgi:uncharacterized RDD family membrane protein YckC
VSAGGLGERLVARLIDFLLVVGVSFLLISGVLGVGILVSAALIGCLTLAYFVLLESATGRTLGKLVMKLRVLGTKGGRPTIEQTLRRNCWVGLLVLAGVPLLGLACLAAVVAAAVVIGVQISSDPMYAMAWHDRFAGTRVLQGT